MRVLVTGGAGYIGSISVEALLRAGHDVEVLDDLSMGHREAVPDGVRLYFGTYVDAPSVEAILRDDAIDAVLHCGARSLVGESVADPARYYRQNVAGGVVLLEAMRAAGVRRLVFSSSAAVYGIPERTPIREEDPLRPINPYGETKRTFEAALGFYASAYGLRSVSLRYFNAAGASVSNGEDHDPETHLIPNVLRAALRGETVSIFGDDYPTPDGTAVRDYIHVEDLARAHLLALEATDPSDPRTGSPEGGMAVALNLGTGSGFSVRQVVDAAQDLVGRAISATIGPRRAGDPPVLVAAPDRAAAVLRWRAERATLEEMIGSAWAWRLAHPQGYGQ
jgi:UDP-glucose-4-epimerase GalE